MDQAGLAGVRGNGFFDEMDLCGRIGRALNDNKTAAEAERKAALAEYSAFGFRPQDLDEKSRWDTHVGEHYSHATSGNLEHALSEVIVPFIPDVDQLREVLAERARKSPIFDLFSTARVSEGQVVGRSGPPSVDPDGALITYLAEQINYGTLQLAWMIDHIRRKFDVTAEALTEHLYGSLVFAAPFRSLIAEGLDAYLKGDHLKAISVLVPQIENALRRFLHMLGEPPNKPRRGDSSVMTEKTLSDILEHEPKLMGYFKERIVLYLRTFLADGRGQNLRNRISHGLMRAEEFHRGYSDRVLHVLLLLAAVQPTEKQDEQHQGEAVGTD